MDDGGMGSLRLQVDTSGGIRRFGRCASELRFRDVDGVLVVATLNIDDAGLPFELDMWKTNFEPLKAIPEDLAIE